VLTLYGTEIWHYRRRWPLDPFTRAYTHAAEVTFYSQGLLDHARAVGLNRAGLSVVYPPVHEAFAPLDDESRARARRELGIEEPIVVLNVKRLHELAGQTYLLDAFARVVGTRSDVRLVICGTGSLRDTLEQQARQLNVSHLVTFTGLVPNDRVARYAAVAAVFVLPSLLEALPTVAVEALAAGTPVVSADHPGGLELGKLFGQDVSVVPRKNVPALADAMAKAIAPQRRVTPATTQLVRTRFRREAVESAYLTAYARVLASSRSSLRE
jgi:glycosyltransferase involved in cell wall biosynthesis